MISSCFQSLWLNLCCFPQVGRWAQRVKFHTIHRLIPPSFLHAAWLQGLNWCRKGNLSFPKYLQDSSLSFPWNLLLQHNSAVTALPNSSRVATIPSDDIRGCHDSLCHVRWCGGITRADRMQQQWFWNGRKKVLCAPKNTSVLWHNSN